MDFFEATYFVSFGEGKFSTSEHRFSIYDCVSPISGAFLELEEYIMI